MPKIEVHPPVPRYTRYMVNYTRKELIALLQREHPESASHKPGVWGLESDGITLVWDVEEK